MDFSTLRRILHRGALPDADEARMTNGQAPPPKISSLQEAYEDLQRIFLNCMHYNKEIRAQEGSLSQLAKVLLKHARSMTKEMFAKGAAT